jgi:hypothetical protein
MPCHAFGKARHGKAWQGMARHGMDKAWTRHGIAMRSPLALGQSREGMKENTSLKSEILSRS